nr:bifunctional DedA family/phosphatase PAP2 family protein [uncultured Halomonas sp.]
MIDQLVSTLTTLSAQHWLLAYTLVGLVALAEAIPVVGIIAPGSVLIVAISALVPSGALNLWPLIMAAFLGAVAGDGISFWMGRRFEHGLVTLWPLRRYPRLIAQAERFFRRHGGKSVFLARFIQGPRAFVPLVAGMSDMAPTRFYAFNIASASVWAPSHVIAGVALGASLHLVSAVAGRLALFLALIALLAWAIVWLTRRVILGVGLRWLIALQRRLLLWSAAGHSRPKRLIRDLLQPGRSETRVLLLGAVILMAALWLFLGILEDLLTGDPLVQANQAVFHFLQSLRTAWGDHLMLAMTELGDSFVVATLTVAVLGWLLWQHAWQAAGYWVAAIGGAALFTPLIKRAVHWPRPTDLYSGWDAFSFPSGHATINAVLYGFLGFLITRQLRARGRVWVLSSIALIIMMIAFSRLYLGAHWLADVVAGAAVAMIWVTLLSVSYTRHRPCSLNLKGLAAVAVLTLACVWPYHMYHQFAADKVRYTPQPQQQLLSMSDWQDYAYRRLPTRRIDLGGESEEPMTLQWAGSLMALKQTLTDRGWQPSPPWNLSNTLPWLSGADTIKGLPVLPRLNNGHPSASRFTHAIAGEPAARLVLQVWPTSFSVKDSTTTLSLWLGSLVKQRRYHLLRWIPMERTLSVAHAIRTLAEDLGKHVMIAPTGSDTNQGNDRLILAWPSSE